MVTMMADAAPAAVSLEQLFDGFLAWFRAKPSTRTRIMSARRRALERIDGALPAASITEQQAEAWRLRMLDDGYSRCTVARDVKIMRQVFRWGTKRGMVKTNPFLEVPSSNATNQARQRFVDRPTIEKVMAAMPNASWRLLVALCRFGGLRVNSEALQLRWSDIDWAHARITVRSPKTEHHEGGASRVVPIFKELRPYLEESRALAPVGRDEVFGKGTVNACPNGHFGKILNRAGIARWPRLFQNLRASCETELAAHFPLHVVCRWIGNSKLVAQESYLMMTSADWSRAVGGNGPAPLSTGGTGHVDDGEVGIITGAWHGLPDAVKAGIVAMVSAASGAAK